MKKRFNPGDYIVTSCGFRGYVQRECEGVPNMYEIRLPGGPTVRASEDLELDPLMQEYQGEGLE